MLLPGLGVFEGSSSLAPRDTTCGYLSDAGRATRVISLCLGGAWLTDAEKILQLHEEYENSKSCLLEPYHLLWLQYHFRRQPLPRITLRRGVQLGGAPGWMDPPLRFCVRLNEHGAPDMVGSAKYRLSRYWVGGVFARSMETSTELYKYS